MLLLVHNRIMNLTERVHEISVPVESGLCQCAPQATAIYIGVKSSDIVSQVSFAIGWQVFESAAEKRDCTITPIPGDVCKRYNVTLLGASLRGYSYCGIRKKVI